MRLMLGDCIELMDDIPSKSINLICCDMPYGTTRCRWDSMLPLDIVWRHYQRIIKDNGAIVLFAQTPFDKVLGCSNLKWLRYEIIWEKGTATGYLNAKKMPMKAHENILVFYKKQPTYNPQKTNGHSPMNKVYNNGASPVYGRQAPQANRGGDTTRYPRSVQRFSVVTTGTLHPTQKPLNLIEYLIKTYTNEGDIVLDHCMGSGTTGVACKKLNRDFIGIEIDDHFFNIAKARIEVA